MQPDPALVFLDVGGLELDRGADAALRQLQRLFADEAACRARIALLEELRRHADGPAEPGGDFSAEIEHIIAVGTVAAVRRDRVALERLHALSCDPVALWRLHEALTRSQPCRSGYVLQLRDGNRRAWADLIETLSPILRAQIARQVDRRQDDPDVDDCVQGVWDRALEKKQLIPDAADDSRAGGLLRAWLATLAQNHTTNVLRSRQVRRCLPLATGGASSTSGRLDPAAPAPSSARLALQSLRRRLLEVLPQPDKRIVELRLDGLTFAAIAAAVGLSVDRVRGRWKKVLETAGRLREQGGPR